MIAKIGKHMVVSKNKFLEMHHMLPDLMPKHARKAVSGRFYVFTLLIKIYNKINLQIICAVYISGFNNYYSPSLAVQFSN